MNISKDDSFVTRLYAYTKERFPVIPLIISTLVIGLNSVYCSKFFFSLEVMDTFGHKVILGLLNVFLIFFQLRLMDEFKDYEEDRIAYPDRLLSRGIVTKDDLKKVLFSVIGLEIIINLILGPQQLILWAMVFTYSLLMFKEFFIESFLKSFMALYLFTHQLIIPMIIFYFMGLVIDLSAYSIYMPKLVVALLALSLPSFIFEIGRKTWNPEREQEHADSYTKSWGAPVTLSVLIISSLVHLFCLYLFAGFMFFMVWQGWIYIVGFFLLLISILTFFFKRSEKVSKTIEGSSSLLLLLNHLSLLLYFISYGGAL
jgi:hypothetical protein